MNLIGHFLIDPSALLPTGILIYFFRWIVFDLRAYLRFKVGITDDFDDEPMHGGGEGLDLGPVSRTTKFFVGFPVFVLCCSAFLFVSVRDSLVCKIVPQ